MSADPAAEMKKGQSVMWGGGDYATVATYITGVAEDLIDAIGITSGQEVLDVGAGTGNAAIPAAQKGATVTGLDLSPALLEQAKARAAEAGAEVKWIEGDAEALPFEDASFDVVMSVVGHMFAPRHRETADQLLRVCRSGGTIGFSCWTPEGLAGKMFAAVAAHMPPPPEFASPPVLWGSEDHVREMIGDGVSDLKMERRMATITVDSIDDWADILENRFPPMAAARGTLEPEEFSEAVKQLTDLFAEANEADDGTMRFDQEYLRTVANKTG